MTDREKLEKLKKLADAMFYAAQQLTTDASRLHKAMDEYHKFIINEYQKEEPEYLEEETKYCAFSTSRYTDKERKALCKGCEEECRFNKKEVLISENLLQASIAYADAHSEYCTDKNGRVVEHYNIRAKEHFIAGAKWQKENLWKPADGDDLPEYEREVVVFTQNYPDDAGMMMVAIGHRPNPNGWNGKSLSTGKVEHYTPKTYDKGGWNIPDIVYWLDVELPKEIEL